MTEQPQKIGEKAHMAAAGAAMTSTSRIRYIEEHLQRDGRVAVKELARELQTSEVTIRRYLDRLVERGMAERARGGAIALDAPLSDPVFTARRSAQRSAKVRIGRLCASLVPAGVTLFLGGGSTTSEAARFLAGRADLTIYTSNLAAACQFRSDGAKFAVIGGAIRGPSCSLVGSLARAGLSQLRADYAIIGADSISCETGALNSTADEADVARQMIERSHLGVICVVDDSKWGVRAGHVSATVADLKVVVSDAVPQEEKTALERHGVTLALAPDEGPDLATGLGRA